MNMAISVVKNGQELMDYLAANLDRLPQLLFLDLNMPLKNGMQCLFEIKSDSIYNDICIAIYSTSGNEEDIENTFMQRANVYIQKPVDFDELKAVLKKAVVSSHNYQSPPFNKANFLLRMGVYFHYPINLLLYRCNYRFTELNGQAFANGDEDEP